MVRCACSRKAGNRVTPYKKLSILTELMVLYITESKESSDRNSGNISRERYGKSISN
ncbi:unnamed protein product, partial [Ectocarpus sp. 8 AP-2014]